MKRIRLHNEEFEGENDVYVLDDGTETVLVDAGAAMDTVRSDLEDGLATLDRTLADVDAVVLTHWHHDHAGLAGEIQRRSGATVYAHEADAPLIAGTETSPLDAAAAREETLREWGVPEEPRAELADFVAAHLDLAGEDVDVTPLTDGDTVSAAGVELEAVHLPGHAAGLTAYATSLAELRATTGDDADAWRADGDDGNDLAAASRDDGATGEPPDGEALFVGDAILPVYTPNVGGADVRVEGPLAAYADSLVRLAARAPVVAFPGHRDPITDPVERAATILEHHRDRTRNVVDALATLGPSTPWEVSAELFGDLAAIHILHGPGEAYAHLDHLAAHGVAERDGRRYELVDTEADVDVDGLFPTIDAVEDDTAADDHS
ncbi:MBL fold metallo-hydrolase [Halobaculum sp. MBLA0147]|uniref:MBL fold metallo-hydrolase n=1 Tax=Halobaculum sp. MBLA0147 TaxID=3079934 RepID=UPI003523E978